MSATKINWADQVWNFLIGCDRVSEGCDTCYAIFDAWMRAANPDPKIAAANAGLTYRDDVSGLVDWTGDVRFLPGRLDKPLRTIAGQRWFVNSKSDLFHKHVQAEWIAQSLAVMAACPRHTFLTLTKRAPRMRSLLNSPRFIALYEAAYADLLAGLPQRRRHEPLPGSAPWPIPGLHLGVSAESQETAEIRLPDLLRCRDSAGKLWVSYEPAVSHVDLQRVRVRSGVINALAGDRALDWVVVGGESGPLAPGKSRNAARPADLEWFYDMKRQCQETGTAYWVKQTGTQAARQLGIPGAGGKMEDLPADLQVRELPAVAA